MAVFCNRVAAETLVPGGAAVTHEQRNPAISKAKIPNVCGHFDVRRIDVYRMLREREVSWDS